MTTRLACLTPAGTGAIATLAVVGPDAWTWTRNLFQRKTPERPEPKRFWFGRLGDSQTADEVVVAVNEMEPEPRIEIHCHGGVEVVRFLEELFVARGAIRSHWAELSNEPRWQLAAVEALSRAPTVRTAKILLEQYSGTLGRALERGDRNGLLSWAEFGLHLTEPWRVVLAGAPNVGKSSLGNALAGFERSLVSPIPGTTRDVVTTSLAIDGWPMEFADTAGQREADEELERAGVERAQSAAREADLVIWVLDGSRIADREPQSRKRRSLTVINKTDLAPAWDWNSFPDAVRVSAATGTGLTDLCQRIAATLVPRVPPAGTAVPVGGDMIADLQSGKPLTPWCQ